MNKSLPFLSVLLVFNLISNAQDTNKGIEALKKETNANITIDRNTGQAEFVKFPMGKGMILSGKTEDRKVFSFLQSHKSIFKIDSVEQTLVLDKVETNTYGLKHVILRQTYKGIPVFDGQLRFHFDPDTKLTAINGNYISGILKLNHIPSITVVQANAIALETIRKQKLNISGKSLTVNANTLYVFSKGLIQGAITNTELVYEVEVKNDSDVREFLYVNAHTGKIVEQFTGMTHGLDRKIYEKNTDGLIWQEGDEFPGTLTLPQRTLVESSGHVYNFFKNAFGFVSYNNGDAQMKSINNHPGINCDTSTNANWNGTTANFCDSSVADDVVAHEWGHAYTEYTSRLIYAYQAGAINESYSDIWGETIDILNGYEDFGENLNVRTSNSCNSTRWKIGEDATGFSGPIRDMWNPNCNGDPGKVTDSNYYCGEEDNGGVHSNSGVPNHAFALLVDGGVYNGQTINRLGFVKAVHVFWRAQSVYLTRTSNFNDLANALEAACADLVGINLQGLSTSNLPTGLSNEVITAEDCLNVERAVLAVELRINPDACEYQPILSQAPILCESATRNPLFFENWESGLGSWTVSQIPTNPATWQSRNWVINSTLPGGRTGKAIFGIDPYFGNCDTDLENGIIRLQSPIITLPNIESGNFEMAFNHYIATESQWDGGNIKYSIDGEEWTMLPGTAFLYNPYNNKLKTLAEENDNPMEGQEAFTGTDGGTTLGSWGQSVINLSELGVGANSSIQFRFDFGTDGCTGNDGWYIDEIVIYNCSATLSVADSNSDENNIKVFPNPTNGLFTLKKTKNIALIAAEIFDINGRSIKSIDLTNMQTEKEIDISNLASGIYFMSVTTQNSKSIIKILRQ